MDLATFLSLSDSDLAHIVRDGGDGLVCVFPYNGTRRWFELEHPDVPREAYVEAYMAATAENLMDLCQMFFDHGVDTLLIPLLSPETVSRGPEYMNSIGAAGLARLVEQREFRDFYERSDARVHFYGDHRKHLAGTPYTYLSDLFDQIAADTADHGTHRIFYAVFAQDATDTLSEFTVQYFLEHGTPPDKRAMIEHYYGEHVEPVDLFVGFGKLRVFDMPLVATGREGLYFTVSPSPYMTAAQLREILHDWLYNRRKQPLDSYAELLPNAQHLIRTYYRDNIGRTLGVGTNAGLGFWYPLPQVIMSVDAQPSVQGDKTL